MCFAPDDPPILLTGSTGHTGRRVAQRLLERGARVRCLVHTRDHESRLPRHDRLEIVHGSAQSAADLAVSLEGINTVIHLAHIRFAPVLIRVLSESLAPATSSSSAPSLPSSPSRRRLIAMSSTRMLSRFATDTRDAVRAGEEAITSAPPSIRWTILRPSMIFGGPDDNNLERLATVLRRHRFFPLFGSGRNLVQPIFVWDLVDAIVACLERPATVGRCYTLAGPEPLPFRAMVETVARACGAKPPVFVRLPLGPSLVLARCLRRLWPNSPLDPEAIQRFGENKVFDISKARRDLAFAPTPLAEALERKFKRLV